METKNQLAVFDPLKAEVAKWKEVNEALNFDYENPDGEKAARSHIFKLRGTKSKIAAIHKEAKAEALAHCRAVDGEKNYLLEEVEAMINVHQKPIDAIAERKRVAELAKLEAERLEKERIEQERLNAIAKQEAENAQRTAELEIKEAASKKAEEDRLNALAEEENRIAAERAKFEAEKKAEADARKREAEAKRQAEINAAFEKKEAAEKAEQEKAEAIAKAEQEKAEAIAKAEQEKAEAIEAEKEKARKLEVERVKKIQAEQDEKERLAVLEAERIADEKHRCDVESEVCYSIIHILDDPVKVFDIRECAQKIVDAIRYDKIPNVTINY